MIPNVITVIVFIVPKNIKIEKVFLLKMGLLSGFFIISLIKIIICDMISAINVPEKDE